MKLTSDLKEARQTVLSAIKGIIRTGYNFKSYKILNAKVDHDYWKNINSVPSIATASANCTMDCEESRRNKIPHCGIFAAGIYYKWGVTRVQCSIKHHFTPQDCHEHIGTAVSFRQEENFQNFDRHSQVTTPALFVHVIPHGLINTLGYVLAGDYFIMPIGCTTKKNVPTSIPESHYKEVFSISQYWGGGFFHANVEDIPRLAGYVAFLREFSHIYIHTSSKSSFTQNALEVLELDPKRIVTG